MLARVNRFIISCSESWWKVLLLFVAQMSTFQLMNRITARFPDVTADDIPFDMQNDLTAPAIFEQLAGYSDEAFRLYYQFQALDYLFPVFAGLFLASLFAFGLRHAAPGWYAIASARNLLVLMLAPTLFDYLENIHLLWVVMAWPDISDTVAQLAVAAKRAKLACLYLAFAATGAALLAALLQWARRRFA